MRADIAPFGVDVMLTAAGLGVLVAIDVVPRRISSVVGALGLAYMTGVAVVPLALGILLVVDISVTLMTFAIAVLVCVGIGATRWRAQASLYPPPIAKRGLGAWQSWSVDMWVLLAFLVLFGLFWGVGMISMLNMPLSAWDAWSIWARKAEMLTVHSGLIDGFFANPAYGFAHLDYPLQYPIWEALHFRAAGSFQTQLLLRHLWLMLGAFVWATGYLVREQVRAAIWAPILLLVAVAPGVWQQLITGYADIPMAMFIGLGTISLGIWLRQSETPLLIVGAIMLAAAANVKNEGMAAAMAVLLVVGVITLHRKQHFRAFFIAASGVIAAILPWRAWVSAHGIAGDMPVSKGLHPGYLFDRIERVGPAIEAINAQLADQSRWLYLLPLAALLVAASLVSGLGRRVAAFYLGAFLLTWTVFVWSYWISPHDLEWHLSTSVDRVVSAPMFVCIAAVVHLSGVLISSLSAARRRSGRAPLPPT